MKKLLQVSYFLLLFLLSSQLVKSQGYSDSFWYFGNNTNGIEFSRNMGRASKLIENQAIPFSNSGTAVATDAVSGQLLFYTDGTVIYNKAHQVMTGGNALNGDVTLRQPVAISPSPNANDNIYFVYYITAGRAIEYVVVDMDAGEFGEVTAAATPTGLTNASAAIDILAIPNGSGSFQYFLLHENTTSNEFNVSAVNADGTLGTPQSHTFSIAYEVNNIAYQMDTVGINFAFTSETIGTSPKNVILLQFDTAANAFTEEIIQNSGALNQEVTDVAFSPAGLNVYYARNNLNTGEGAVFQFSTATGNATSILNRTPDAVNALQKGPDNSIYFLYQNNTDVLTGSIGSSDSIADSLQINWGLFESAVFANATNFSQSAPAKPLDAAIDFDWYDFQLNQQPCQNNIVSFYPSYPDLDDITTFTWDFGNGTTSDAVSPVVIFDEAGTFQVNLQVDAGGNMFEITKPITIQEFSSQVQLQDTTVCELPLENYGPTLSDGSQPDQVVWINPDPAKFTDNGDGTATFLESGTYTAAVTVGGCTVNASFELTLYEEGKQVANYWYFGDGAGIDFNGDQGPQPVTDGAIEAEEGCATVSDDNGDLLFYTNGETVWNSEHQIMPNGEELGGDQTASQGVIAIGNVQDPTLYYIFTAKEFPGDGNNELSYSILDMKLNNGLGDIVLKNRKIYTRNTERVSANAGANATELLVHEFGSNTFRAYPITDLGIEAPEFISEGSAQLSTESANGYTKYGPGGDQIATAFNNGGAFIDYIRQDSAGNWEHAIIDVSFISGTIYGIEFSPSGDYLYATITNGGSSSFIQVPVLEDYTIETIEVLDSITVADVAFEAGAIQTGPDGQLYIAANNSGDIFSFGSADNRFDPDNGEALANALQAFNLSGRTSRLGLPNFAQNLATPEQEPTINVIGNCSTDSLILQGSGTTNFDQFYWTINESGASEILYTSTAEQDTVDFLLDPGDYEVALRITNECGFDTLLVENVSIFAGPDLSNLPASATFCTDTLTLGEEIVDDPGNTYQWSNGDTTRTITVTEEGIYTVTATSAAGCVETAEIFVGPPYEVNLGEDRVVCQDEAVELGVVVNANNYRWFVNDVLDGSQNDQTYTVDTSTPGDFTIRVEIEDPLDPSCYASDEVLVTVIENPVTNPVVDVDPSCGNNDGEVTLTPSGGSGDYTIVWNGPTTVADNTINATGLEAGSYNITITDNLTGCTNTETVALSNQDFTVSVTPQPDCGPNNQGIEVTLAANTGTLTPDFNYTILDQQGTTVATGTESATPFTLSGLPVGDFSIEVIDNNGTGCLGTASFTLQAADSVNFEPAEDLFECGTTFDLLSYLESINSNATFNFASDPGDTTAVSAGTYTITATQTGLCEVTRDITINLSPSADISQIESQVNCDGGTNLTAVLASGTPSDFTFSWSNGDRGQTITVNQPGTYTVSVYPTENVSCAAEESITLDADDIYEPITAQLIAEPNCTDGTVLLRAEITGGTGSYSAELTRPNGGSISPTSTTPPPYEWDILESNTYTLTITDQSANGCPPVVLTRQIVVQETFAPSLQDNYFICPTGLETERSVTLDPGSFGSYLWTLPNGSTSTASTITANQPGTYSVVLTAAGCEYNVSTTVLEDCKPKVFAPNAIKPMGSIEANRTFTVFPNDYVGAFQILIYNRWGTLVYESDDKDFQWDATDFSGEEVPQGTYAYIINFSSTDTNNDKVYEQRGGVTVIR